MDNDSISYFCTSRVDSVPFPAPGFPNMSIRRTLPSPPCALVADVEVVPGLVREKGMALLFIDERFSPRWICQCIFGRELEANAGRVGISELLTRSDIGFLYFYFL